MLIISDFYYLTKQSNQKNQIFIITVLWIQFIWIHLSQMLDITRNLLLRCQLSYFYQANIKLHQYDSFSRFTLSLCGDINTNPSPVTVNDNKIPLTIWNRLYGARHRWEGEQKVSLSLKSVTHTLQKWNLVQLYVT